MGVVDAMYGLSISYIYYIFNPPIVYSCTVHVLYWRPVSSLYSQIIWKSPVRSKPWKDRHSEFRPSLPLLNIALKRVKLGKKAEKDRQLKYVYLVILVCVKYICLLLYMWIHIISRLDVLNCISLRAIAPQFWMYLFSNCIRSKGKSKKKRPVCL